MALVGPHVGVCCGCVWPVVVPPAAVDRRQETSLNVEPCHGLGVDDLLPRDLYPLGGFFSLDPFPFFVWNVVCQIKRLKKKKRNTRHAACSGPI